MPYMIGRSLSVSDLLGCNVLYYWKKLYSVGFSGLKCHNLLEGALRCCIFSIIVITY